VLSFAQHEGKGREGVGVPGGCSSPAKRPTKASAPGLGRRRRREYHAEEREVSGRKGLLGGGRGNAATAGPVGGCWAQRRECTGTGLVLGRFFFTHFFGNFFFIIISPPFNFFILLDFISIIFMGHCQWLVPASLNQNAM